MLRVGLKLRRKFEGLAYQNAENHYPRRTIGPKGDTLVSQFKKLNGSPGSTETSTTRIPGYPDPLSCIRRKPRFDEH